MSVMTASTRISLTFCKASGPEFAAWLAARPPDRKTLFKGPLGVKKRAAWSDGLPLDDVQRVCKHFGGTVNEERQVLTSENLDGVEILSPQLLHEPMAIQAAQAGKHIARYKLPKAFVFRDEIVRSPSGKADYRWASEQAAGGGS